MGAIVANLLGAQMDCIDANIAFNVGDRCFVDNVSHGITSEPNYQICNQRAFSKSVKGVDEFS